MGFLKLIIGVLIHVLLMMATEKTLMIMQNYAFC